MDTFLNTFIQQNFFLNTKVILVLKMDHKYGATWMVKGSEGVTVTIRHKKKWLFALSPI